jgi:hypothetical protein
MRKYAARLDAGETTLTVLSPAFLAEDSTTVTVDGAPAPAFTISGHSIVFASPLETGGYVEVTFSDPQ